MNKFISENNNIKNNNIKLKDIYIDNNYNFSNNANFKDNKQKINLKQLIIKFLFPLSPLKITTSVYLISFLAILVAIRLILSFIYIPIVNFGFNISFGWIPIYICGFFCGPVIGMVFGFLMDTLVNLITGGVWFWLYAIQEPIIGLISGIIGSLYLLNKIRRLLFLVIIEKVIVYFFVLFSIFIITFQFYNINQNFSTGGLTNLRVFTILSIVLMIVYLIVNEIQSYYLYKKSKKQNRYDVFVLYLYLSFLVLFVTILFSFMLGPISFVKYIEFLNGSPPNAFLNYGAMYYLLPRVLKESIKTPIYIILLIGIVIAIREPFLNIIKLNINKWGK